MSPMAQSITAQLQRALHDLDEHRDANERAHLYSVLNEHMRSAAPILRVEELEAVQRGIAAFLERDTDDINPVARDHLVRAAEMVRKGEWRNG